ncbi:MAG: TonB-dependent receptor [Pseudomonadota bacterium]
MRPVARRSDPTGLALPLPTVSLAALLLALPSPALAQEPAETAPAMVLDEIVISPTRSPIEAARTGQSVEVLDREDLDADPQPTLVEALEVVPGVAIANRGGPGTSSDVSIRGFAQEDIMLRIDGIEFADPGELRVQADFGQVLTGDIGRIEVLKGAQSALYGGEAVGGVIDITTGIERGVGRVIEGSIEGGSFGRISGVGRLGFGAAGWDASIAVQGIRTEGFSAAASGEEEDGYRNITVSGTGTADLDEDVTVGAAFRYFDRTTEIDGISRGVPRDALDATAESEVFALRGFARFEHFDDRLTTELSAQGLTSERVFVEASGTDVFEGDRVKLEYLGTLDVIDQVDIIAGADWTREAVSTSDGIDASSIIYGGFGQAVVSPIEQVTLTGSLRGDRHSEFGGFLTWRVTGAVEPIAGTTLRAAAGTGFRAPSNRQLFDTSTFFGSPVGNPDLDPEETFSWEAGIDQAFLNGRLVVSATYFDATTDNLIDFVFGEGFTNIDGKTTRQGLEFGITAQPVDWLDLTASYTLLDTETPEGQSLQLTPEHDIGVSVIARPIDALTLGLSVNALTGVQDDRSSSVRVDLDPFVLVNASAAYAVREGVELYVRGENLLDHDYERVDGFQTAGASVFGGIRLSLP